MRPQAGGRLTKKWNLGPLTKRVAAANSFGPAIRTTGAPRSDTPVEIPVPVLAAGFAAPYEMNRHQAALVAFGEFLDQEPAATREMAAPSAVATAPPAAQAEKANTRVRAFLARQKAAAAGS